MKSVQKLPPAHSVDASKVAYSMPHPNLLPLKGFLLSGATRLFESPLAGPIYSFIGNECGFK
jgi:hypothetical protein